MYNVNMSPVQSCAANGMSSWYKGVHALLNLGSLRHLSMGLVPGGNAGSSVDDVLLLEVLVLPTATYFRMIKYVAKLANIRKVPMPRLILPTIIEVR